MPWSEMAAGLLPSRDHTITIIRLPRIGRQRTADEGNIDLYRLEVTTLSYPWKKARFKR